MNAMLGWALAVVGTAMGYVAYGWPGVVMALSVIVFWLLLQFSRAMRVMRLAGRAPVGQVPSAVMLHARLHKGQRLMDVIMKTKSLGERIDNRSMAAGGEAFSWSDGSGARVVVSLLDGRVTEWVLQRPGEAGAVAAPADPARPTPSP